MVRRTLGLGLTGWIVLLALLPAVAGAHAVLDSTSPDRGAQLERAPGEVVLRFDEPVEIAFGAVRVYDQGGERVDRGSASHPDGRGEEVAVALRDGLGDGTYTATYRVVSGDSHPISGGFVFSVGKGGAPSATVDELIDATDTGPVTDAGLGIVRVLSYLALALTVGGVAFALAVWRPLVPQRLDGRWPAANDAFARRASRLLLAGITLGIVTSAAGIVFQGAVAGGTAVWAAIDANVIGDVLETRFGTVWGEHLLVYVAAGALLLWRPLRGLLFASGRRGGEWALGVLAMLLLALCLTPALAGHASTSGPGWLLIPASALHVLCMSVWVGGIAMLLLALPAATREFEPGERMTLLARTVSRFSTVALIAVAGLILGGVVQAVLELDALSDLTGTAFGRAILIKVVLLGSLIALGAWHRQRSRPRLVALADGSASPGAAGVALRRALRAEGTLMVAVLAVAAALVSYSPATATTTGPFSASESLGPARMELTVDPARAGRNEIHLYLFDRRSGRQFDRTEELAVTARLPEEGIGPLALEPRKAGPGHYVIRQADIAPPGEWSLDVDARVSAFDAYSARVEVPIR